MWVKKKKWKKWFILPTVSLRVLKRSKEKRNLHTHVILTVLLMHCIGFGSNLSILLIDLFEFSSLIIDPSDIWSSLLSDSVHTVSRLSGRVFIFARLFVSVLLPQSGGKPKKERREKKRTGKEVVSCSAAYMQGLESEK